MHAVLRMGNELPKQPKNTPELPNAAHGEVVAHRSICTRMKSPRGDGQKFPCFPFPVG